MLKLEDELQILLRRELPLKEDSDVIKVVCDDGQTAVVIERLEDLLQSVLREAIESAECSGDEEIYGRLTAKLPTWFPDAMKSQFDNEWDILDWLFWFLPNHDERTWRWHGIGETREDGFNVLIGVSDYPFAWEALRVGIICSGGQDVIY